MLVKNMVLELLLPQHDQLANTERVVTGVKQRALIGWHEAICARPMAQARRLWERMARSTRQRQRESWRGT